MSIDSKSLLQTVDTPQTHSIDIKHVDNNTDTNKLNGIEFIKTQYYFKKDFYSFAFSKNMHRMLMCNVNERIILSSQLNLSLLSDKQTKVEEHSENMFHITCCGASLSKD